MNTSFILTSTAEHLRENLKKKAQGINLILPEKNKEGQRFFPDGEVYMRLPQVKQLRGKRVVVLHSGAPNPNDGLMELKLLLHILKDHAVRPHLFFTYFPYGQQDHVFQRGEGNIAESLIKKFLKYYGVKKIYAIDPHFGKMKWVKNYPIVSLSTLDYLQNQARREFGDKILFLSPDKGGKRRTGVKGFKKKRLDSFTVETFSGNINLEGKIVGVIDDLLETGGTLAKFHETVARGGVKDVFALITHGVLDSGIQRIKEKFSKLYLTNTINRSDANVDVTDLIVKTFGFKIK